MFYKLLWLPTKDQIFTDGWSCIDKSGNLQEFDADQTEKEVEDEKKQWRVAEPLIVEEQYNSHIVIGRPTAAALKWLKPGENIKAIDCKVVPEFGFETVVLVKCPVCGVLH